MMRAIAPNSVLRPDAVSTAACRTPAPMVEVARMRVRAAALNGDHLAVEAAGRAYVVAVSCALVVNLVHIIAETLRPVWRGIRTRHARGASTADLDP